MGDQAHIRTVFMDRNGEKSRSQRTAHRREPPRRRRRPSARRLWPACANMMCCNPSLCVDRARLRSGLPASALLSMTHADANARRGVFRVCTEKRDRSRSACPDAFVQISRYSLACRDVRLWGPVHFACLEIHHKPATTRPSRLSIPRSALRRCSMPFRSTPPGQGLAWTRDEKFGRPTGI